MWWHRPHVVALRSTNTPLPTSPHSGSTLSPETSMLRWHHQRCGCGGFGHQNLDALVTSLLVASWPPPPGPGSGTDAGGTVVSPVSPWGVRTETPPHSRSDECHRSGGPEDRAGGLCPSPRPQVPALVPRLSLVSPGGARTHSGRGHHPPPHPPRSRTHPGVTKGFLGDTHTHAPALTPSLWGHGDSVGG